MNAQNLWINATHFLDPTSADIACKHVPVNHKSSYIHAYDVNFFSRQKILNFASFWNAGKMVNDASFSDNWEWKVHSASFGSVEEQLIYQLRVKL